MPTFKLHLRRRNVVDIDEQGLDFPDLHHAYLGACAAIPDLAREQLVAGADPMSCAFIICDAVGQRLMEVPFSDVLSPAEWRLRQSRRRPARAARRERVRDDLALTAFHRMFDRLNVGCVLMTPELEVREMNVFGARHSHVDPEAIRGASILDIFDLVGEPKKNFTEFMLLARAGASSQVVDLPYLVLDEHGQTVSGWWNARTWPIFDDDDNVLGLVEWAEPFTRPTASGQTIVGVSPSWGA